MLGPDAWINGASPTEGFLSFGLHTKDPFLSFYQGLALLGCDRLDLHAVDAGNRNCPNARYRDLHRIAAIGGAVWMVIFYTAAALWPENNPLIDDHIIEAVVLVRIAYVGAGRFLGLGNWWRKTELVRKYPVLE